MSNSTPETRLKFIGPYRMAGDQAELEKLPDDPGVYLWCVQTDDAFYRVHYVGESSTIRTRNNHHANHQMLGRSQAYSPESLRDNTLVLVHRAGFGIVPKFENKMNAIQANQQYLNCLSVFYATIPEHVEERDRRQFETAVGYAIQDWGRNILVVGSLNKRADNPPISFSIDTGCSDIEGLTGQLLNVYIPDWH